MEVGAEVNPNGDVLQTIMTKPNPLLLSPVIQCVYEYLGLQDIKNCRLVAREWSLNSKLVLRHRSKIVISNNQLVNESKTIPKFLEDFSDTSKIPFDAYKLTQSGPTWNVNELNEFFENQQRHIKELDLQHLVLNDGDFQNIINKHCINSWISKSLMATPNTKYKTKLSVACSVDYRYYCTTNLWVSLSVLTYIKSISFTQVLVNIDNAEVLGLKMNPVELKLDDVKFTKDGKTRLDNISITNIADLSNCKELYLKCGSKSTKITLDLCEYANSVNLDKLTIMEGVTVVNWESTFWKVKELILTRVPHLSICNIRVVKLQISFSAIDLSALPPSIEILTLTFGFRDYVRCTHPVFLPKLKCLYLKTYHRASCSHLYYFRHCPKLVEIHIAGDELLRQTMIIKFEMLPKSIRKLHLEMRDSDWEWQDVGDKLLIVDQLVLLNFTFDNVKRMCINNILVKDITLNFTFIRGPIFHKDFLGLLKYFNDRPKYQVPRIFVGPLCWKENEESCLHNFVDKISEYYVFENQRGVAIDKKEFLSHI